MNLLQLVQAAAGEMGLTVPTSVVGNAAQDPIQILALANAVGGELQREFSWEFLAKEYRFVVQSATSQATLTSGSPVVQVASTTGLDTTYSVSGAGLTPDAVILSVDSATQVTLNQPAATSVTQTLTFGKTKYALPPDFDRLINRTQYDKSKRWAMIGPETAQQWQFLKSSYISTGPRLRFRVMGGYFQIWPLISTPEVLGYEYYSNGWVNPGGANPSNLFAADTDTCAFPDRLMILGIKLKYFEAKGFDTTALYRDYTRHLDIAKASDHAAPTLSFIPSISEVLIGYENIPDTGYGS